MKLLGASSLVAVAAWGMIASVQAAVVETKPSSDALLRPVDLIQAPRPGAPLANPDGTLAIVGVSEFDIKRKSTTKTLYFVNLSSKADPKPLLNNHTSAIWLSSSNIGYVRSGEETKSNNAELWVKSTFSAHLDPAHPGQKVGEFPKGIEPADLKVKGNILVFSAEVYEDGKLETVPRGLKEDDEARWDKVKVYDSLYVRHWDTWLNPRKRKQLFYVKISAPSHKEKEKGWKFEGGFKAPLQGTKLQCPVAPFGDSSDFDLSAKHLLFTSKDPIVNPAWHTRQNVYIVPLFPSSGSDVNVQMLTSGEQGATSSPILSENGKWAAWLEMARDGYESDRRVITMFDLEKRRLHKILPDWDRSPSQMAFSADARTIYGLVEDAGHVKVFLVDLDEQGQAASSQARFLTHKHSSTDLQVLPARGKHSGKAGALLFGQSSLVSPLETYVLPLHDGHIAAEADAKAHKVTSLSFKKGSSLKGKDLDEGEEIWFTGSLGRPVHAWVVRPPGFKKGKKYPVVLMIHGGPEGAWTSSWSTRWNPGAWAAQGYIILAVNPTGSTGYGQAFTDAIQQNWGNHPYKDLMAGLEYFLKVYSDQVDVERIVAAGASYGGYMANFIQGHNPGGIFKAIISHDGIFSNENGFYATEELYFAEQEFGGTPWEAPANYRRYSPNQFVSNWRTPQLVIHGGKDYRLTESEGLAVFNALQRRGVPSRFVYFPEENHWVIDPLNSLRWHDEIFRFMDEWVGERAGSPEAASDATQHANHTTAAVAQLEKIVEYPGAGEFGGGLVFQN